MDIFFKSPKHKERFVNSIKDLHHHEHDRIDPEYGAALYILTMDDELWEKSWNHVNYRGLDIETMLESVDLSGGYKLLVQLAGNLFNGRTSVDPCRLADILSHVNFQVAISAQWLRHYSAKLSDFE